MNTDSLSRKDEVNASLPLCRLPMIWPSDSIEGATKLLHTPEQASSAMGLYINAILWSVREHQHQLPRRNLHFNLTVEQFTYLSNNIASSSKEVIIRIGKAWSTLKRLSVIWKPDISDNTKKSFFRTTAESVLLYGSSNKTLASQHEVTLNGNYTKMLRSILNVS